MFQAPRFTFLATALFMMAMSIMIWLSLVLSQAPDDAQGRLVALFPFSMSEGERFAALARSQARFVRETVPRNLVIVDIGGTNARARLEHAGAILVYDALPFGGVLGGCVALVPVEERGL